MADTHPTAEQMTRAEIRAQIALYVAEERQLVEQIIGAEKAAGFEQPIASSERDKRIAERAKARLAARTGKSIILKADVKVKDQGLAALREEREGVQLIIRELNEASLEAAAAEALARAQEIAPALRKLYARRDTLKVELDALDGRIAALLDAESGDVRAALTALTD